MLKHLAAKMDKHHPKSQADMLYISRECLFPETCQYLCRILSPVPATWLLLTKEGWLVLVSTFMFPYSTVLPPFTAFSPVRDINPQPQDILPESWISDCGNLSDRVYLQVLHDLQGTSQTGFTLFLLYLTTLLKKWRKSLEGKLNIFTSGVNLQEAPHSQKKTDDFFSLVYFLKYLGWKIFSLRADTSE